MLFPQSHPWTRLQRRLIAVSVICALGILLLFVSIYETRYRGPDEQALFGTWRCVENCISKPYAPFEPPFFEGDYCFKPDHSFTVLAGDKNQYGYPSGDPIGFGRWYAGGSFIYFHIPGPWFDETPPRKVFVWHIQDIGSDKLRVRLWADKPPRVYQRVSLSAPNASNQALQPTPLPVALLFRMSYPRVMKPCPQRRG
jgi:hypothetical protein